MRRAKIDIDRLLGELDLDLSQLEETEKSNAKAHERIKAGADDALDYAALGYTLHNMYGIMENACLRIAKFFENGLSPSFWHREILQRMLITIPGVRPAFFSKDEFPIIDDFRAFRHVFRNLYGRPLDVDRVLSLQAKVPLAMGAFRAALTRYRVFLGDLKSGLED